MVEVEPDRDTHPDHTDDDYARLCRVPNRILNKEQLTERPSISERHHGPGQLWQGQLAGLPYDGPGCSSSKTDRGQEIQHPAQAEQHIAEGAKHIEWQREVLAILERVSMSAEAIEGARAVLTTLLEAQAQREQERVRIVPLAQPVDQQNQLAGVGDVAGPPADWPAAQREAKRLANLGEHCSSETATCDAVSQDEAADRLNISRTSVHSAANRVPHFKPFGNSEAIEPKVVMDSDVRFVDIAVPSHGQSLFFFSINFDCHPHFGARLNSETISVNFGVQDGAAPKIQRPDEQSKLPVSEAAKAAVPEIEKQHHFANKAELGYICQIVRAAAAWIRGLAGRLLRAAGKKGKRYCN
jgi:ribosomal protein L16/L10AE